MLCDALATGCLPGELTKAARERPSPSRSRAVTPVYRAVTPV
jgi:hypothetical protein